MITYILIIGFRFSWANYHY